MRMGVNLFFAMVASLAFVGIVQTLTTFGLTSIKNDCYERLAIGQRLNSKNVYKTFDYNTLADCQKACTKEKTSCKAFSFGIGTNGNGSCDLSADLIKETVDLKPIGMVADTDYDLYIKKLGCSVVIDKSPHSKPLPSESKPNLSLSHEHGDSRPSDTRPPPQNSYEKRPYNSNYPNRHYLPSDNDEIHHVQTLVSVASGPQSYLHPIHDILVGENPYEYGKHYGVKYYKPSRPGTSGGCCEKPVKGCCSSSSHKDDIPPFRPPALNHPYDYSEERYRPKPGDRPDSLYDPRRGDYRPHFDYGPGRPPKMPIGPDFDGYDEFKPERPYGDRPIGPVERPNYDKYDEFKPNRPYGDRPVYNKYDEFEDRPSGPVMRPDYDKYDELRPDRPYGDRPIGPAVRPDYDKYDGFKPSRPNKDRYDDDKPPRRPFRPEPQNYDFRPGFDNHIRPPPPRYGSLIPHPDEYNFKRPQNGGYFNPEDGKYDMGPPRRPNYYRPNGPETDHPDYHYDKPTRPLPDSQMNGDKNPVPPKPADDNDSHKPSKPEDERPIDPYGLNEGYSYDKPAGGNQLPYDSEKGSGSKPIVSHSVGSNGQQITSIITEIKETCFRRVLAGKRVSRRCVKKALTCETVEACQKECADEKYFICEGFNYRLDPTGRGKGECELLDVPLSRLDIGRDLYPDPDYDYYERDRNAASAKCKQYPSNGYSPYPTNTRGYGGSRGGGSGSYQYNRGYYGYDQNRDGYHIDRRYDEPRRPIYEADRRPSDYGTSLRRPGDKWTDDGYYDRRRPRPDPDRRLDDYRPSGNRRGDYSYHQSHSQHDYENSRHYYNDRDRYDYRGNNRYSGIHYLPAHYKPHDDRYDYKSYEPYLPPKRFPDKSYNDGYDKPYYYDKEKDRHTDKNDWGSYGGSYGNFGHTDSYYGLRNNYNNRNRYDIDRRNYYLPTKGDIPKDWGLYGGSYGNGGYYESHKGYGNQHSYNYYGFSKYDDKYNNNFYHGLSPSKPSSYLPLPNLPGSGSYLPVPRPPPASYVPTRPTSTGGHYLPFPAKPSIYESHFGHGSGSISSDNFDNSILPAEPRIPFTYNFIKDECSLRSASGFRLHKGIVKKFYAVPSIYECEILCFKETDFPCQSYAYKYTISTSVPTYNCYLSNKNYKELDHYTDLEPDRDFDIYTMNNRNQCESPVVPKKDYSECFWRVRSGQRLNQKVVRDSLTTKSVVDCQIECLHSTRFTCRAFSYRYGSPVIGGAIDNCQLTDCSFYELDPRLDFVPEPGFEVYERGSFGHGCEPDHFGIRGKPKKDSGIKVDQLCYVGFGTPARLLPQATKKSLYVVTELECKVECSKLREGTLFQCMSFSYRTSGPKTLPNCQLSDILQRDLLPNVDYIYDPDSWLFAWDNYNPECIALANEPVHDNTPGKENGISDRHDWDSYNSLDTWRVYSVSGWPCRRGTLCKENREAGFWSCELEGGDKNTWDYCCRPDHQCGASNGYPYQWCYVGPVKTQWRKCSDRYYPYVHNIIHTQDPVNHYLPPSQTDPWTSTSYRPGARPDRPQALPLDPPPRPSLDDYEKIFDNEFLDPPKPGGFGQPRHWPVSYLHKEMPPNTTDSEPRLMRMEKEENPKYAAIRSLISVIRNNDLQNVQYHIANDSNKADDVLFVRIPLPTNFTQESKSSKPKNELASNTSVHLEPVYFDEGNNNIQTKRSQKSLPLMIKISGDHKGNAYNDDSSRFSSRPSPVYRRGFVTRTNITHG